MSEYIEHDRDKISVGIVEKKLFTFAEPPDEMVLESGARVGPLTLAYETCGTLNEDKSNVILILHALSGDSHVAGYYTPDDEKPGWWDNMVGPGKGIDTDKCVPSIPRPSCHTGWISQWSLLEIWSRLKKH